MTNKTGLQDEGKPKKKKPLSKVEKSFLDRLRTAISDYDFSNVEREFRPNASSLYRLYNDRERTLQLSTVFELATTINKEVVLVDKEIKYFPQREHDGKDELKSRIEEAQHTIQILISFPSTKIHSFLGSILEAIRRAKTRKQPLDGKPKLSITILASNPISDNNYLKARADELNEDADSYTHSLRKALDAIRQEFLEYDSKKDGIECQLKVYNGLPIQSWHRIDDMLYLHIPSHGRRSRENCMLGIPVALPGVQESFIQHFEYLRDYKSDDYLRK